MGKKMIFVFNFTYQVYRLVQFLQQLHLFQGYQEALVGQ